MPSSPSLPPLPKETEDLVDAPYGGLFGNSVLADVVEEFVASPSIAYQPKDLKELTERSEPRIRSALATLLRLNLIENVSSENQIPRYRVKVESKKFVALSFLAYAMLDDRDGSDCMDLAVHDYYSNYVREKFEPLVFSYDDAGTTYDVSAMTGDTAKSSVQVEAVSGAYFQVTA